MATPQPPPRPLQDRAEDLFAAVYALPPGERTDALDGACGGDPGLRRAVDALLSAHDEPLQTLRAPDHGPDRGDQAWLPERIAGYRIVGRIGSGGMGIVYEAIQDSPRRRVAIKLLHPLQATAERLRRLRHEAELLGRLHHPGIAQVLEAGTYDLGRGLQPFFAMELVDGVDLRTYCERQQLDARARMELLARVADAVDHAHGKGVVHRDLKPENILVDAHGTPKVLDFGIARATDDGTLAMSLVTQEGQILGTLAYMAPEQLTGDLGVISPRTDVYGLGVVGFELMVGQLPFNVAGLGLATAIKVLHEHDAPRLGTIDQRCRGDVEAIIATAIEKDRTARYGTAGALAADIRRWLRGEPVLARRIGRLEQARRFVRRHRVLVGAAMAVIVSLTAGLVAVTIVAAGQHAERLRADSNAARAEYEAYVANIGAAKSALDVVDGKLARDRLDACPERLRGWEWQYLDSQVNGSIAVASDRGARDVAMFPDGARVLTAGPGRSAFLRDARTLERLGELGGHEADVSAVAISLDGSRLLTGSTNGDVRIWDGATLRQLSATAGDGGMIRFAAFARSGKLAATGADDGTAALWDVATGARRYRVSAEHGEARTKVAFTPDDAQLIVLGHGSPLRLIDVETGAELPCPAYLTPGPLPADLIYNVAFDPSGEYVAFSHFDTSISVRRFGSASPLMRTVPHQAAVETISFSADGRFVLSTSYASIIRLWERDSGSLRRILHGHTATPERICTGVDGLAVSVSTFDGTTRSWMVSAELMGLGGKNRIVCARFAPDGRRVVASCADGCLRLWSAEDPRDLAVLKGHAGLVFDAHFSADGRFIVSAGEDDTARVWDAATGAEVAVYRGHDCNVYEAVLNPDGTRAASRSQDGRVSLWDARTGAALRWLEPSQPLAWYPQGSTLIGGFEEDVLVWDEHGTLARRFASGHRGIRAISFNADGSLYLTTESDGCAVWRSDSHKCAARLSTPGAELREAVLSPDGSRIFTISFTGHLRVHDGSTGRPLLSITTPHHDLPHVSISPDGSRVIASGSDTAQIFDAWSAARRFGARPGAASMDLGRTPAASARGR